MTLSATSKASDILARIERAKGHVVELNAAVAAFLHSQPYEIGTKHNPITRQLIYYLTKVEATPASFSVILGDVLQNLRSALDHLFWLLTVANGKTPGRDTYFPISDTSAKHVD